ncbi:MAG: YlmC/YmxH family sporulation protein [Lachnospiraceae bacterium]|nr:YlmC/YmxH family sporulation protein [Lachnospiraceae bacterium]
MTFFEFKQKEVINIRDCKKLGHVTDLEFDECSGQIKRIIVPGRRKWFDFLGCDSEVSICYCDIRQIGPDIILVDI